MMSGEWIAGQLGGAQEKGNWGDSALQGRRFDLASLTKVLSTSFLLVRDFIEQEVSWENFLTQKLSVQLPELIGSPYENISLGEVWEHRSGLPAHILIGDPARDDRLAKSAKRDGLHAHVLSRILAQPRSPEQNTVYSDLGFMLLGIFLERGHGKSLREMWIDAKKFLSMSAQELPYSPLAADEVFPTDERHAPGEVNDDNAFSLGGAGPHAGLFGRAAEIALFLEKVSAWAQQESRLSFWLHPRGAGRFWGGWDRPSGSGTTLGTGQASQAGAGWPEGVIGHLGYTGTAFWWHPGSKKFGVLLTNRVHPHDSNESKEMIKSLRREFFSCLWQDKLKEIWGILPNPNGLTSSP